MSILTSLSNPLRIDFVTDVIDNGCGKIGLTICPGKHQAKAQTGDFQRNLSLDLDLIKYSGVSAIVTLMSDEELSSLHVAHLGLEVEARGMQWYQLPIADQQLPDETFERHWVYAGLRLRQLLSDGKDIVIHCRSGLGRSGLIAARLLIELGTSVDDSIAAVRKARAGTLEKNSAMMYLQRFEAVHTDDWMNSALGCLFGGAVGDAFGYAVEFDDVETIKQRFGPKGLLQPVYRNGKLVVSDDTQMTLFTLEALLRCVDEDGDLTVSAEDVLAQIAYSYREWYATQYASESGLPSELMSHGRLASNKVMQARRAPGNTCLSALSMLRLGSIESPINDSKGCGGVMRTAPIGFLVDIDIFDLGARAAALTHGHVDGWAPAGVLARIIRSLINGDRKFLAVRNGYSDAGEWSYEYGKAANTSLFTLAVKLAKRMRFNPQVAIPQLGLGWVGDEALAISLYSFLSANSFTDAIQRSVNHSGDSDSTGSITGQLWGAMCGLNEIPQAWVRRLDVFDVIVSLAASLQHWHRDALTSACVFNAPVVINTALEPAIHVLEMVLELHTMGYQKIRVLPYPSDDGRHWCLELAASECFSDAVSRATVSDRDAIAHYSTADMWRIFDWENVNALTTQQMAKQFLRQFPAIEKAGAGIDWEYCGWLCQLLGEVRKGSLPYIIHDEEISLFRGMPTTTGKHFPLPPYDVDDDFDWDDDDCICDDDPDLQLDFNAAHEEDFIMDFSTEELRHLNHSADEEFSHNPEDDEDDDDESLDDESEITELIELVRVKALEETKQEALSSAEIDEQPSDYNFSYVNSRAKGLVAFYHQGEGYLFQTTQLLWNVLPDPKAVSSLKLCKALGIDASGKIGIHKLLEVYLVLADKQCERALEQLAAENEGVEKNFAIGSEEYWAYAAEEFGRMDEALWQFALNLSNLIETLIQEGEC